MAERAAPGTAGRMSEAQISDLTSLAPTSEGQATLMQLDSLKILLDWAVLNGVIPAVKDGQHPLWEIHTASEAFFTQRKEVNAAMSALTALPTRKDLAIRELQKVFPGVTGSELERMNVIVADPSVRRNMPVSEPRTRSLIETYMTGDLKPGKWVLAGDMPQPLVQPRGTPFQTGRDVEAAPDKRAELDTRIRLLPDLAPLLETALGAHLTALQAAYVTNLLLRFTELPLEDRQFLHKAKVDLFTVRGETGLSQATAVKRSKVGRAR